MKRFALICLLIGVSCVIVAGTLSSWDSVIANGSLRFQILVQLGTDAVRDKETELVWEKSPDPTLLGFAAAVAACAERSIGGRHGWKMPTLSQLSSLLDDTQSPPLSPQHPFVLDDSVPYWAYNPNDGLGEIGARAKVTFSDGTVESGVNGTAGTWCVRSF